MATEQSYFTLEQLIRKIQDRKQEIRYIQRKILVVLAATTVLLIYVCSFTLELRIYIRLVSLAPVLFINAVAWALWMLLTTRRALSLRYQIRYQMRMREEDEQYEQIDEYRRLSYQVVRYRFWEMMFDLFAGIQILLVMARLFVLFIFPH